MNHLSSLGQGKSPAAEEGVHPAHQQKGVARTSPAHLFLNERDIFLVHSEKARSLTPMDTLSTVTTFRSVRIERPEELCIDHRIHRGASLS